MNRRGFFARIGTLIAGATVATRVNADVFKSKMFGSHEPMVGSWTTISPQLLNDLCDKHEAMCEQFMRDLNRDLLNGSAHETPRGFVASLDEAPEYKFNGHTVVWDDRAS